MMKEDEVSRDVATQVMTRLATATGMGTYFHVSRSRVYQWMEHPDFPKPIPAPWAQAKMWNLDEVQAWRDRARP